MPHEPQVPTIPANPIHDTVPATPPAMEEFSGGNGPKPSSGIKSIELGEIQALKEHNVSRGCEIDPVNHPVILALKEAIENDPNHYLLEPIAVRDIAKPVARPCGSPICCPTGNEIGEHIYVLVFGFRRFTSCRLAGKTTLYLGDNAEVKLLGIVSDHEAAKMNIQENTIRGDPTEYEAAKAFYDFMMQRNLSVVDAATLVSCRIDKAQKYVRIFSRCPPDLLAAWRSKATPDMRRRIEAVSKIEGRDEAERHRLMRDEWTRLDAEGALTPAGEPTRGGKQRGPRSLSYLEIQALREQVDRAVEIYDTADWRLLTESEKRALHAVLRHVAAPRQNGLPLR